MKKVFTVLGCTVLAALTGCVSTPIPPMDRRVTVAEDLGTSLYVTDVRCVKGDSGFATFQANVVNNTSRPLRVDWKVVWLDIAGVEIEADDRPWFSTGIQPK